MKRELYIGCSSYATSSWKTLFYPDGLPKKMWFDYYARQFNTYEFNGSFYRFPTVQNLLSWHDKVPDDFKFSVKVPRSVTHIKRLENCAEEIKEFYAVSEQGLKNKLACILWQLPPTFSFSEQRLWAVIQAMNPTFKNVVEFRHESWWQPMITEALAKHHITFCNVNYPGLPTTIQKTSPIGYVRMHGNPKLFYSAYSKKEVETLYREIRNMDFEEIYIYFNNTASTAAIINALQLKEILGQTNTG